MMRKSRAPVIPLSNPNTATKNELILEQKELIPRLLAKMKNNEIVDIIRACMDPAFDDLAKEIKTQLTLGAIQDTEPINGVGVWFKTRNFSEVLDDNEQL